MRRIDRTLSNCCWTRLIGSSISSVSSSFSMFCCRWTSWYRFLTALQFENKHERKQKWLIVFSYKITLPSCNVFSAAVVWIKVHSFSARRASISARSRSCCKSPIRLFNVKIWLFLLCIKTKKNRSNEYFIQILY